MIILTILGKKRALKKKVIDAFVAELVHAGFPETNILTMPTGLWIEVTGTVLTVEERVAESVTTKRLCYGDLELAKSVRQPLLFGGVSLIYTCCPEAIKQLPRRLLSDVVRENERSLVGMGLN